MAALRDRSEIFNAYPSVVILVKVEALELAEVVLFNLAQLLGGEDD